VMWGFWNHREWDLGQVRWGSRCIWIKDVTLGVYAPGEHIVVAFTGETRGSYTVVKFS
jgi:hypothetical protein